MNNPTMDTSNKNLGGYKGTGQYGVFDGVQYNKPDANNPYGSATVLPKTTTSQTSQTKKTDSISSPTSENLPRVTPTSTTTTPVTEPTQNPKHGQPGYVAPTPIYKNDAEKYLGTFSGEPESEEATYEKLVGQSSDLINSVTKSYEREAELAHGQSAASIAAAGLGGSSAAIGIDEKAIAPILEQRNNDLAQIYDSISKNAITLHQQNIENARQSAEDVVAMEDKARTNAVDSIKALATNHLDWQKYKQENPENYGALVTALGGDPNVADAMFAMSIPANVIDNSFTTSDGQGGTVVTQISHDPVTNKPSIQKYTIPGIDVPQNWASEKFGTNATIYKSPQFNPNDPSTYVIVSTDPTNNGAITVTKNGQTTINGVPINSIPGINSTSSVAGAAPAVASIIGINDPTAPLSSVISDPTIGIEGIVSGIIKNEGGSPKGVLNNPGNIKFVGAPGQKDSGVKATDGGTFASYSTPQDGKQAIADMVNKGATAGKTFEDFINSYTGTGGGTPSASGSILSATGISLPVFNYLTQGTSSMSRMSASDRKKIMEAATEFLNSKGVDVSTFQSQYKAYNDVLNSNIQRNAKVKIMENELSGTVGNLLSVVDQKELGNVNVQNVAKVWSGQQVNDPLATQYAFHFEQLKNELAGYFAASQGKSSPDVIDNQDAANAVINGMSTGSLTGFKNAIESSTSKMGNVLQKSVDDAQKNVWSLFGVGDKFVGKTNPSGDIQSMAQSKGFDYQAAKNAGYSDEEIMSALR